MQLPNYLIKLIAHIGISLSFLVLFSMVYNPVIQKGYYAFDDYDNTINVEEDCDPLILSVSGRIVTSYFACMKARYQASSSEHTKTLRFLGIIGIALLASTIYAILILFRLKASHAFLMSTLILTLPAFQVYVSWLSCLTYIYSAFLSCLSALIIFYTASQKDRNGRTYTALGILSAISLLLIALNTYQPTAMMYWAMGMIFLLSGSTADFSRKVYDLSIYFIVGLFSMVLYFAVFIKILPPFMNRPISIRPGGHLLTIQTIPEKLKLFYKLPFNDSINLWNIHSTYNIAIFIGLIIIVGIILRLLQEHKEKQIIFYSCLPKLFLIVFVIMLSYTPNLVIQEKASPYRTLVSLETTLSILLFYGVFYIVEYSKFLFNISAESRKKVVTILLLPLTIITIFLAYNNVNKYFVMPNSNELTYIKNVIRDWRKDSQLTNSKIYIRRPPANELSLSTVHNEFRIIPATHSECGLIKQVVKFALNEIGVKQEIPISHGSADAPIPERTNILLIDMTKFQ